MTDAMENAAIAFDQSMGRAPARRTEDKAEGKSAPESIFENMGDLLPGEEQGGGDSLPSPTKSKREKVAIQPDPEDDDDGDDSGENQDEDGEDPDRDADDEDGEGDEGDEDLTEEERAALRDAKGDDDDELMSQEFDVMVDGVEKKVKLREALDGYIRADTFHQRLNHLNEVKQSMVDEAQIIVKDREKYISQLKEAEEILAEMMPVEPDWDAEFAKDGVRANALRKQYDVFKGKVAEIRGKRENAQKEAGEASVRETNDFAKREYPRFVQAAGWKNTEDQVRDTKSMRKTALSLGFSEQEISAVYDSRLLQVLLKASKYDRMMASRPKPVNKNGKTQQVSLGAGRTVSRTAPKGIGAAQSRLSKTGSIDDAASVFDQILSSSRKRNR